MGTKEKDGHFENFRDFIFDNGIDYSMRIAALRQITRTFSHVECFDEDEIGQVCSEFIECLAVKIKQIGSSQAEPIIKDNSNELIEIIRFSPRTFHSYLKNIEAFDSRHFKISRKFPKCAFVIPSLKGISIRPCQSEAAKSLIVESIIAYTGHSADLREIPAIAGMIKGFHSTVGNSFKKKDLLIGDLSKVYMLFLQAFGGELTVGISQDLKLFRAYKIWNDENALFDLLLNVFERGKYCLAENQWITRIDTKDLLSALEAISDNEDLLLSKVDSRAVEQNNVLCCVSSIIADREELLNEINEESMIFKFLVSFEIQIIRDSCDRKTNARYPVELLELKKKMPQKLNETMKLLRLISGY